MAATIGGLAQEYTGWKAKRRNGLYKVKELDPGAAMHPVE